MDLASEYMAGAKGLRVIWRDGSETRYRPFERFHLSQVPLMHYGPMHRIAIDGSVTFEAPQFVPNPRRSRP